MSIGENIRKLRENPKDGKKKTQEELAKEVGVSFQAVSAWERDEYIPETAHVLELMKALDASADAILDDRKWDFETKEAIFDWEHMKTYVKTIARNLKMENTLKAIDFAVEAHKGQPRKNTTEPYIIHPLTMACHALAMGIKEDEIIAGILLHDVVEDCKKKDGSRKYKPEDLPVNSETQELVRLMTKDETPDGNEEEKKEQYYAALATNPKAALIKCIDRCNNKTTMSWGFTREGIYKYIGEGDKYYPKLLDVIKSVPKYNDAAWLLKYHMESMLDIYKRLV